MTTRLTASTRDRAAAIAARFPASTVLVVGDVMLDQFLVGRVTRISPEAPVPIVHFDREENRIGGAANVAHNVVGLGARAEIVGLVGEDEHAAILRGALASRGIGSAGLVVDRGRPTTRKVRVVTDRHQQVARVDYERDNEADATVEAALIARAEALVAGAGVVVVSDYLKGAVTERLVAALVKSARARGVPLLVDPKIPTSATTAARRW